MRLTVGVLLLTVLAATPATAKPKHWHEDEKHWNKHSWNDDRCYFPPAEVRIIREYYEPRDRSLPPGLAKKYYRTGHLPPGWQKKMDPLPVAVERRLIVLPPEYRRGYMDGSVLVYSPSRQVVVDVVPVVPR
jgi:hypothetical protein